MRSVRLTAVVAAVAVSLMSAPVAHAAAYPRAKSPAAGKTVRDGLGAAGGTSALPQPTLNVTPSASYYSAAHPDVIYGGAFTFTVSGQTDAGDITGMSLAFGDGITGGQYWSETGGEVYHTYQHAGVYQATLTVTYVGGRTASVTEPVVAGDTLSPYAPPKLTADSGGAAGDIPAHAVVRMPEEQLLQMVGFPADAIQLNVTVADASASGFVTLYPDGTPRPVTSNLNFAAGQTIANEVSVRPGADQFVDIYNGSSEPVGIVISTFGLNSGPGWDSYFPVNATRLLDTRAGRPVAGHGTAALKIAGTNGVPADAAAVLLNVTETDARSSGYLTTFDTGLPDPTVSELDWSAGQTAQNLVLVPLKSGTVDLKNNASGSAEFIADLVGYVGIGNGSVFMPTAPARLLDTRNGTGAPAGQLAPGRTLRIHVPAPSGIDLTAAALNLTVTGSGSAGYLVAYADGTRRPATSSIDWAAGQTVSNMTMTPTSTDGYVDVYNAGPKPVSVIADLSGYYFQYPNQLG